MALRYLQGAEGRAEGRSFLRFITYVAIGGVALGVAALLLSLTIVRGFSEEIQDKIVGVGAHVQVRSYVQDAPLSNAADKQAALDTMATVTRVMPVVEDFVLLRQSKDAIDGVALVGVAAPPPYLEGRLVEGRFALSDPIPETSSEASPDAKPAIVIGQQLANRFGVGVGEVLTAFSLQKQGQGSGLGLQRPRVRQFVVAGIYETSLTNIDDLYVFTSIETARALLDVPDDRVTRFDVTTSDLKQVDRLAAQIESTFGFPVAARTVYQQFAGLFAWVNLQESIIPLVIGVIVIVAAFNIIGTLLMMILEKTREIGVLQSLGAAESTIKRLFLVLGFLIGTVGTGLGMTLALGLALLQERFEIIPLPAEAYYMSTAPVSLNPFDFLIVGALTLILCTLAAYVPARVAARIEPVRAIRFQ